MQIVSTATLVISVSTRDAESTTPALTPSCVTGTQSMRTPDPQKPQPLPRRAGTPDWVEPGQTVRLNGER